MRGCKQLTWIDKRNAWASENCIYAGTNSRFNLIFGVTQAHSHGLSWSEESHGVQLANAQRGLCPPPPGREAEVLSMAQREEDKGQYSSALNPLYSSLFLSLTVNFRPLRESVMVIHYGHSSNYITMIRII